MNRKRLIIAIVFIVAIVLIIIGILLAIKPAPNMVQGQIELEEIDVASKVPGRIGEIFVTEGDRVEVGTPLIKMNSPEVDAKIKQATAASEAADAVARKAKTGARPQEIEMAKQTWQRAQAGADLARKSYNRVNNLAKEGLVSLQKRDEAYANYVNYRDQAAAAKAQYNMALEGARIEDQEAAQAQARQVQGAVDEARVAEDESNLKSPVSGIVAKVIGKVGEIMPQGVAVVTVALPNEQTLYFNVKETELSHFNIGDTFKASIPALGSDGQPFETTFKVIYSSPLADFATWRPTRNSEGFDIKTFEIKAEPTSPIPNARSGMSVIIKY
ncbi:biotin/lipoyl-binding protein [Neisseriaceae bacterium PsAf]|nr:biotin/lipoyl-binding protein [Neisseriaceae bacterium PsAf]